ncbi:MAG: nicotinate (nicotinamide) nucleotide adenylyltransferase [Mycoplasmataceae bacterium]|nr:nicotinate (nicotinamide) nucleotide adenylyltransferase [Mycoplasmataceae bacterium]
MKKIVIFGGTFDPIHLGHLSVYKAIKKHYSPNKFIIVPSKKPPLKPYQPFANAQDRINMIKLLFNSYKDVMISNFEIEQKNNQISYTINTLKHFKKKYPKAQIYLVLGTDRYQDFKLWKDWKVILKLVKLIVIKRYDTKIISDVPASFVDINPVPISSSDLRKLPQNKYLTPKIANYIANHGLYINCQIKPLMSSKRYQHTLRVTELAMDIAKKVAPHLIIKAYIAGMYHDVGKEFSDKQVKKMIKTWNKHKYPTLHTLHGFAGALYIKKVFNIKDREILNAIENHVIPCDKPRILDMIIYCADKLEPMRTKDDVTNRLSYIKLVKHNLKLAFTNLYKETSDKYN